MLKVVTFKVPSYCERVNQDDSPEIKEFRALKQLRPLLSHTRIIALNFWAAYSTESQDLCAVIFTLCLKDKLLDEVQHLFKSQWHLLRFSHIQMSSLMCRPLWAFIFSLPVIRGVTLREKLFLPVSQCPHLQGGTKWPLRVLSAWHFIISLFRPFCQPLKQCSCPPNW